MSELIDFSSCRRFVNDYSGEGMKFPIEYDGERYMLKLAEKIEPDPKNPLQASYSNTPVSEHVGSSVAKMIGLPAQESRTW